MKSKTIAPKEKSKLNTSLSLASPSTHYVFIAALLVAVGICFVNSLTNEFVFDDHNLVFQGRVSSFAEGWQLLQSSYRPLRTVSYAIDFAVWGDQPWGFHLTNLLIHSANTIFVFVLLRKLTSRDLSAFLAALIFAVHPIQTDAVTYISGRRDVLFALFYLAAFYAYLQFKKDRSIPYLIGFFVAWALSMMSKEMAASLPLIIFLWNFCELYQEEDSSYAVQLGRTIKRALGRDKWLYILLAIGASGYAWYMVFIKASSGRVSGTGINFWGGSLYATILTSLRLHAWYLKQLVYPTPIAQYLGVFEPSTSILDWRVILSAIVVLIVLAGGFLALRKERWLAFAIFSFFALLSPVSQLIPHHELIADHYLYLPMMSFGLFVGVLTEKIVTGNRRAQGVTYAVVAAFVLFLGVSTILRNRDWKNDFTLWQATYQAVPNSPRAAYNYGGMLQRSNPERAEQLLKQSITNDPDFEFGYLSLSKLYLNRKQIAAAEETVKQGLALLDSDRGSFIARNKTLLRSQFTLIQAGIEWEKGSPQKTEEVMLQAIQIDMSNEEAYLALAALYKSTDRAKEIELLRQAIALNPKSFVMTARLADGLVGTSRLEEAATTLTHLSTMLPDQNDCSRAAPYFQSIKNSISRNLGMSRLNQALQLAEAQCGNR